MGSLRCVCKRRGTRDVLTGVSLQIHAGETLALLGPNGAGKSTAISLLLGLLQPDSGEASLFGQPSSEYRSRRGLGVMLQDQAVPRELSLRELLHMVTAWYADPRNADEVLQLTGTTNLAHRRYGDMSFGQRRQVHFALALCGRPRLIVLDEPSAGLDADARERLWAVIRTLSRSGAGVLLTTHDPAEAEALADRIVLLREGALVAAGSAEEIRSFVCLRQLSCVTRIDFARVRSWPEVLEAHSAGSGQITLMVRDAEAVARRLLLADETLHSLEINRPALAPTLRALQSARLQA